jgi:hypothetical protein
MNLSDIHRPRASRRAFLVKATSAGTVLTAGLSRPKLARADDDNGGRPNPIPGGLAPFVPFGIFIHHNPLNPANPLSSLNDPSQITDFNGFVGLTHIRGGGTGTNTITGASTALAYQADMGFSQGAFIGTDGHQHEGTFAFV